MNPDLKIGIEKIVGKVSKIEDVPAAVKEGVEFLKPSVHALREKFAEIFSKSSQLTPQQTALMLHNQALQMGSEVKYYTPNPEIDTTPYRYHSFSLNPFRIVADIAGWRPGPINELWGGARPITNQLIGGAILAGIGYGIGTLLEELLPDLFEKKSLRNRAAIIGALLGILPSFIQIYAKLKTLNEKHPGESFKNLLRAWTYRVFEKNSSVMRKSDVHTKLAIERFGNDEDFFDPYINADSMEYKIMNDPITPITDRAIVASLIHTADINSRPQSSWVSPFDVMQTAITLGSGVAQGYLIAKAIGALAGLTPQSEEKLKRLGIWAGAVSGIAKRLGIS